MDVMDTHDKKNNITLEVGHHELIIRDRYEIASISNDILIGLIFLVGSFLFFSEATMTFATWLFVIGSALMLVRPVIRLARRTHLKKINPGSDAATSRDF